MKKIIILTFLLITALVYSQKLDAYKYAIVPSKFDFLKDKNEYRLNEFTKMVMEKYNFETYYDSDVLPKDLNPLNTVYVNLEKTSSLFKTGLRIILNNAAGRQLHITAMGESREKEYSKAYYEALRLASKGIESLNHNYVVNQTVNKVEIVEHVVETFDGAVNETTNQLFAQPIVNGFQLINKEPKVIMKIFKTSVADIFLAKKEMQDGILIKKGVAWYFEYYKDEKLISEKIEIKF